MNEGIELIGIGCHRDTQLPKHEMGIKHRILQLHALSFDPFGNVVAADFVQGGNQRIIARQSVQVIDTIAGNPGPVR